MRACGIDPEVAANRGRYLWGEELERTFQICSLIDWMTSSAPLDRVDLATVIDRKQPSMFIIGCDFHSRFQQIAMLDPTTGEVVERRLEHENGEAKNKTFYATLPSPARVGMEATPPWCGSRRPTRAMFCIFSTC